MQRTAREFYLEASAAHPGYREPKILVRVTPWAPRKALAALNHVSYLGRVKGTPAANASMDWLLAEAIVETVVHLETANGGTVEHRERLDLDALTVEALQELLSHVIEVNFADPSSASRDGQPAQANATPTRP